MKFSFFWVQKKETAVLCWQHSYAVPHSQGKTGRVPVDRSHRFIIHENLRAFKGIEDWSDGVITSRSDGKENRHKAHGVGLKERFLSHAPYALDLTPIRSTPILQYCWFFMESSFILTITAVLETL
jgi:hypothetical protein